MLRASENWKTCKYEIAKHSDCFRLVCFLLVALSQLSVPPLNEVLLTDLQQRRDDLDNCSCVYLSAAHIYG